MRSAVLTAALFLSVPFASGQDFGGYRPHYQGYGVNTPGGRRGAIVKVTNLNDSGAGSLRAALTSSGPRFVIFEVSGTIALSSPISITNPFITVAGQTAPSPGILLRGGHIQIDTHDVVIQHVRVRPGAIAGHPHGIWIRSNANNIVLDHVSVSWTVWTAIDLFAPSEAIGIGDVTIIDSVVSEALACSGVNTNIPCDPATYPTSGEPNSKAFLVGDSNSNTTYNSGTPRLAMIRNISAHNNDRHPMVQGDVHLFYINNLVYNPSLTIMSGIYWTDGFKRGPSLTVAKGNLLIPGLTTPGHNGYIAPLYSSEGEVYWGRVGSTVDPGTRIYLEGNYYAKHCPTGACLASPTAQWSLIRNVSPVPINTLRAAAPPLALNNLPLTSVMPYTQVEQSVIANSGARPLDRDSVDTRIVRDIQNRTGRPINSPNDVGGYPVLAQNYRALTVPADPHTVVDAVGRTRIEAWLENLARALEPTRSQAPPPSAPQNLRLTVNSVSSTSTASPSGLTNGSLESGYTGWTAAGNQDVVSGSFWVATNGIKAVAFNAGQATPNGVLSQAFATTTGQTYTLAFDAGAISSMNQQEQRLEVTVRGQAATPLLLRTVSVSAPGNGTHYVPQSFTFVADNPTTTLTFRDVSPTTTNVDLMLDNVRVAPSTAAMTLQP